MIGLMSIWLISIWPSIFQEISGSSVIAGEQGAAILVRRARSNSTTGHVSEQMVLSAVLS